ncbi:MAG: Ribose-phosphate pyrophosphokinase [Chlamydiales bacterium]|nr:Ribose-phosphate pyrophosphokinase [Chlamydiales bacterium]MCH9635921.1 Ribose-phosphate pyrophosphokinase [Chlamydiales bacterium]
MHIFSGTSHPEFARHLASVLDVDLGNVAFKPFPDGEIAVQICDNVRGQDVYVVQSIAGRPNDMLMELLIMLDALKRASANSMTVVLPYFGYSRQDRKDEPRMPITAKLVANLLQAAGASRVLTMDLHAGQIQGFFDIPVDNLYGRPPIAEAILERGFDDPIVMAPDLGAIKIARAYANHLRCDYAVMDKRRKSSEEVEMASIIGPDVRGQNVLLVDDMCSTGGTMAKAAELCKKEGAKRIFAACTHGLLVGNAKEKIEKSAIERFFCSDTVPAEGVEVVSVVPLFAEAIRRIHRAESLSAIFC